MPDIGKEPNAPPSEMDFLVARILYIIPMATFGEDSDGQIVIHTGLREESGGAIARFDPTQET